MLPTARVTDAGKAERLGTGAGDGGGCVGALSFEQPVARNTAANPIVASVLLRVIISLLEFKETALPYSPLKPCILLICKRSASRI
jgi:hypothetical protein